MTVPTITVVSYTGLIPINLINLWLPAAQVALSRDFAPHWSDAKLRFAAPGTAIQPDEWVLGFFDHSDQASALGYHTVTAAGLPVMKVFVADCLAEKQNWNVTATHEIHETIVDPYVNQTVAVIGADGITREYAKESDDASEDDRYARRVNGHLQSNSVTPAWFDHAGQPPYTVYPCPEITAPFMLASGGYIGWREIAPVAGEWQQEFARTPGSRQNKAATSRTLRRFNA